uniref:PiggyBac transposable element-derived protein domain-containing protein n=1 Tax=Leptobrachium leishanense TaxID=445787 RepID=A0A8C5PTB7_9ANUR
MGIVKKPSIRSYWHKNPILATPLFPRVMKRERYENLMRFLHFNDNALCPPRNDPMHDRLYTIRPLISLMSAKFTDNYVPDQNISVDESLMKFKGRLLFKQYIPSKRSRYGVKCYKLCESTTGYTWAFRIYEGKDSHLNPPGCPDYIGTSGKIGWDLVYPLFNKGYHLWVDNYYTSIDLFKNLYCFETLACGTVRKNRRGFPQILTAGKKSRGSSSSLRQEEVLALRFTDKKDVYMLSTVHDESTVPVPVRGRTEPLEKSKCIVDYSKFMGGVDLADQCIQPYLVNRKTRAWYKKIAIYLTEIAIFNAYVLYKQAAVEKPYPFLEFMLEIISQLILTPTPVTSALESGDLQRLSGRHFPSRVPPTRCKKSPQKKCRVCRKKGIRKDSSYYCPTWPLHNRVLQNLSYRAKLLNSPFLLCPDYPLLPVPTHWLVIPTTLCLLPVPTHWLVIPTTLCLLPVPTHWLVITTTLTSGIP